MGTLLLIAVSAVLGVLRIAGLKTIFFQAVAHVWVGGLFGAWLQSIADPCEARTNRNCL